MHISLEDLFGGTGLEIWLQKAAEHGEHLALDLPYGASFVLVAKGEFESLQETLAIAADPDAVAGLRAGLHDVETGDVVAEDAVRSMIARSRT